MEVRNTSDDQIEKALGSRSLLMLRQLIGRSCSFNTVIGKLLFVEGWIVGFGEIGVRYGKVSVQFCTELPDYSFLYQ